MHRIRLAVLLFLYVSAAGVSPFPAFCSTPKRSSWSTLTAPHGF